MDKNQREERRRQEDIALNRGLLWVGAAILMELLLMLVNKYYINYYSTVESINMVYAFDAGLKAVRIVALIALAASGVWCFLRFSREGRTGTMPLVLVAAFSAVTAIAHITICFKDAGVRMLFLLVPAWAALALVYYLYQREFFYSAFYTGLGTMLLWMLRHKDSTVDPSSSRLTTYVFLAIVAILMVLGLVMLLQARKNGGVWSLAGREVRVLPAEAGYSLIFLTLGILELNAYPLLDSMAVQFIAAGVDMSYSLSRGLGSLSYALACVACGQQAVRFGTESLLLTHMALLVLMIAVVALYPAFPKDALQAQGGGERPHSILYILKSSRPFTLTLVSLFFTLAAIMPIVSFMVNLVSDRGGDEGHLGLALFLMGASELPAALLFTPLFRRFGAAGTLRMSICFMAVKPLLFLLAPGLSGLLLVQPVQLLGYGLFTPASVYYANANVFPVDQVKGQSIMMIASNGLGAMFGNFLAGYAIDWGGADAMLGMCLVFGVIGVLFMLAAGRSKT